jgi:hypothetical protein
MKLRWIFLLCLIPLFLTGCSAVGQSLDCATDLDCLKLFFEDAGFWEWILIILLAFFIIVLIVMIATGGTLLAAIKAVLGAIAAALVWIKDAIIWFFAEAIPGAWAWLLSTRLAIWLIGLLKGLSGWLGGLLRTLLTAFPWLDQLWEVIKGPATFKFMLVGAGILIGFAEDIWDWITDKEEEKIKLPCPHELALPTVTLSTSAVHRDYPGGKDVDDIKADAVDDAEQQAEDSLREKLETMAEQFECSGECTKSVSITISLTPTPAAKEVHTRIPFTEAYEATATAEGTLTIICGE